MLMVLGSAADLGENHFPVGRAVICLFVGDISLLYAAP